MSDLLDHTARQVRLPGGKVHKLKNSPYTVPGGRRYRTRCGCTLSNTQGAVLTTGDVECLDCLDGDTRDWYEGDRG